MNFIFISPKLPHTYWQFCDRLKRNGINVLGIGDVTAGNEEDVGVTSDELIEQSLAAHAVNLIEHVRLFLLFERKEEEESICQNLP